MEIIEPGNKKDFWQDFYGVPERVYAGDPLYLKTSIDSVRSGVERPEFTNSQLPLLALVDGIPVSRIIARASQNFIDGKPGKIGLFSYFESGNDPAAVKELFNHACRWLRHRGVGRIFGPMDGDTWHKYRVNVGPFQHKPFLMEPYNPEYYASLWEEYGFRVFARYYSKRVDEVRQILPGFIRYYNRSLKNGFTYRHFRLADFDNELNILYDLSCRIFSQNPFYTEISREEFKSLYADAQSIIVEDLIWFCQDRQGLYCGFVFALPDYFDAVLSMGASRNLWARLKFLLKRKRADTLNLKTLGTLPEYRGKGLGPALMYKAYERGCEMGLNSANLCLIHEDNVSGRLDGNKGELLRNYNLYTCEV